MQFQNKINNEQLVLKLIYENPGLSRVDLTKILKINKASMSEIINNLLFKEIINEVGSGNSTSKGGRKPIQLEINYDYGLCMGIDIASNYISFILANLNLEIISYDTIKIPINKDNVIGEVSKIIENNKKYYNKYKCGLISVTMAIHGIVDYDDIRFTPNYNLDKINLVSNLKNLYPGLNFNLINESNASALCEMIKSDIKDLVCINIGVGVGAGVIMNGKLITGINGYAGEIGHMIVVPNGKKCKCGNYGCFEQYCSEIATVEYYNSIAEEKVEDLYKIIELYKKKDSYAIETILNDINYMSLLINNIMKIIAPEKIIINSDLAYYIPNYIDLLYSKTNNTHNQIIDISASVFNKRSVLLGSVYNSITKFLSNF
ncbi:MAG: ROK family protein [Anaerococcus sp.]|nr:ROK family protein [Anaerococcus sp.]MDY2919095.1 ROK family protein [Anaerococcus sp.]